MQWSDSCLQNCIQPVPVKNSQHTTSRLQPVSISNLPPEYNDLIEAFNKTKASTNSSLLDYVCLILFLPGTIPLKGRTFPVTTRIRGHEKLHRRGTVQKVHLTIHFLGFFFVSKEDGSLQPTSTGASSETSALSQHHQLPCLGGENIVYLGHQLQKGPSKS